MSLMSVSVSQEIPLLIKPIPPSRLRLALISPFHGTSLHAFLPHISISYTLPYPVRYHGLDRTRNETKTTTLLLLYTFLDIGFAIVLLGLC